MPCCPVKLKSLTSSARFNNSWLPFQDSCRNSSLAAACMCAAVSDSSAHVAARSVLGGLGLGWVLGHAVKTPRHLRRHVIVATGLGNVNQLPLMLVTSMCSDKGALFYSSMGDTCSDDGLAYTVVGMAVASIFHHAVSYHLLKPQPHVSRLLSALHFVTPRP